MIFMIEIRLEMSWKYIIIFSDWIYNPKAVLWMKVLISLI